MFGLASEAKIALSLYVRYKSSEGRFDSVLWRNVAKHPICGIIWLSDLTEVIK
jgi:hypothetical protein